MTLTAALSLDSADGALRVMAGVDAMVTVTMARPLTSERPRVTRLAASFAPSALSGSFHAKTPDGRTGDSLSISACIVQAKLETIAVRVQRPVTDPDAGPGSTVQVGAGAASDAAPLCP